MKIMQRGIMKVLPGKMAEAMELNKQHIEICKRYGMPPMRMYQPFIGGDDMIHTIILEGEWESLEKLASFYENMMKDPEMQELMPKWQGVLDEHRGELYVSLE